MVEAGLKSPAWGEPAFYSVPDKRKLRVPFDAL
jgi:hypothetical protein